MRVKRNSILLFILVTLFFLSIAATAETKSDKKVPDYSFTLRKDVPVEYTWKIEDIYTGIDEWNKDKALTVKKMHQLVGMAKDWTSTPQKMAAFLELRDDVRKGFSKLVSYAQMQYHMDLANPEFQKIAGESQTLEVQWKTGLTFLEADILAFGKDKFDAYVRQEPRLKPYAFFIEKILRTKDHVLPSEQEKVFSQAGLFSNATQIASGVLNDMDMPAPEITLSDGKKVTLNYANFALLRLAKNAADRALVNKTFWENHRRFQETFSVLIDGAMKKDLFNARVHNYTNCLEAKLFEDNIDPAVYYMMIKQVRENLEPYHRYLKLKKELLGLDKLMYSDIYASSVASVDKVYSYDEAQKIILKMMSVLGSEYTGAISRAFDNRWIDRYPNKNKQKGAYSGGVYGIHPFIKMNYDGQYENVSTLAHELGHSMHSYFSEKNQNYVNSDYPSFLAEIASTFNEYVLMDYLVKHETDDLFKLYILDAYMQRVKGSIYRQTQFSEFELAMHTRVEEGQTLTAEWLNQKYLELAHIYYGHEKGVTEVDDYIKNEWESVPHFFLNYYVYTYSAGMIASAALAEMVLNGAKPEQEKFLDFLKSGGSRYPLETLKIAGVDIATEKPYQAAFKRFNDIVTEMEKIVGRLKAKGILK